MKQVVQVGERNRICVKEHDPFVLRHLQGTELFVDNVGKRIVLDMNVQGLKHPLVFCGQVLQHRVG